MLIIRVYNGNFNEFYTIAFIYMTNKAELLYKRALLSFKSFIIDNNYTLPNSIIFKRVHIELPWQMQYKLHLIIVI